MVVWRHLARLGGLAVHPFADYGDFDYGDDLDGPGDPGGVSPGGVSPGGGDHGAAVTGPAGATTPAPESVAWKLATDYEATETFADLFALFLETVDTTRVRALVIGYWGGELLSTSDGVVELLCAHADRFPSLRHLFVGDIIGEEHEISWIPPEDVTPLLEAFPRLEELGYRFGREHTEGAPAILRPTRHEHLRRLTLQTGGMPARVPRAVAASSFPALEHLDLWLGVGFYGGDAEISDLAGLLRGTAHPALRHLGLMNSEIQDEIAAAVAGAPVVARLTSLDLSMGTLSDTGAEALLTGQPLTHLHRLCLRHHFLSEPVAERLRRTLEPAGVEVDLSDARTPEPWAGTPAQGRYTEVSE